MAVAMRRRGVLLTACLSYAHALRLGPIMTQGATSPRAQCSRLASVPLIRMQVKLDDTSQSFYEEYVQTDPETGERKSISLDEKEKLYLECLDAFYNENGKQLLGDDEYSKLKTDLQYDGSKVTTFSADEIKFVLANKRYSMGKPILGDQAYDKLRDTLKKLGSPVVIHDAAKCSLDDGICKSDIRVDFGKTRLLYFPGTVGASLLISEILFWTLHTDPILSIVLGSVPAYFFGVWFTENIFAQKPLVTNSVCPDCGQVNTIFFGDLFAVQTDGIAGPATPPADEIMYKCSGCKDLLAANRNDMVIRTTVPKGVKF